MEHVLRTRAVPADEPSAEHRELAETAAELGLPEPTTYEWDEMTVYVEDVAGAPWGTDTVRSASISNVAPPRGPDHNIYGCPGPGRCEAHHPGGGESR